jgi:hypothetical protein
MSRIRRWLRRRVYRGQHRVAWGQQSTAQSVAAFHAARQLRSLEAARATPLEDLMDTVQVPVVEVVA